MRHKDITGEKFGKLTAIKMLGKVNKYGKVRILWEFRCDCGVVVEKTNESSLKRSQTPSCGCSNKSKNLDAHSAVNRVYTTYKKRARKIGIIFNLNIECFRGLLLSNCIYCGEKHSNSIYSKKGEKVLSYNGIDRQDNSKGYEVDNCVSCCRICNFAKGTRSHQQFIDWIRLVSKYTKI